MMGIGYSSYREPDTRWGDLNEQIREENRGGRSDVHVHVTVEMPKQQSMSNKRNAVARGGSLEDVFRACGQLNRIEAVGTQEGH